MAQNVVIDREMVADFPKVQAFYASVGYSGIVTTNCVVVSAKCGDNIVGAVRLAREDGVLVLRGMRIAPSYQRQRIGTRMLWQVSKVLGARECYWLPHAWLEDFYGVIEFAKVQDHDAPPQLRQRLAEYRKTNPQIIVMRRTGVAL
jgi:N-acetylglutamate synthase-like GNAT family acetyltransferase